MREILRFLIGFVVFLSFDIGAHANPACVGKYQLVELTNQCPSVPQVRLNGTQGFADDEFLYAKYDVYQNLLKQQKQKPAVCPDYYTVSQADGVYECDNDYCGNETLVVLNEDHAFKGQKIGKKRAYVCFSGGFVSKDVWMPYDKNIESCTNEVLNDNSYKETSYGGAKYRYAHNKQLLKHLCKVNVNSTSKNSPAKSTKITVSGTVVDKATGRCVNAATVYYSGVTAPIGLDRNCKFSINNIMPGTSLTFSANGFKDVVKAYKQDASGVRIELNKIQGVDDTPQIGQTCTAENAKKAVWQKIGKEIKCVAKECNQDRYLVVNSKGESQGYCIANTCKAPKTLNIIDGTKTDKRCVDPAASEIAEETIEEEAEEELSAVPVRPDLQINQPCAQGFLTILNAKTGKYAKHAGSDDVYCDITECNENFVKASRNQGETYNVGDATLELQYEICECPSETHTINNEGKCVANTNGVPATDGTPSEDNVSITVAGTIEFEGKDNTCPENVDISVPEGATKTQNGCDFTVGLQTAGGITFSAEGYESVSKSYSESVNNETIVLNKSATDVTDDEGNEDVVSPEVPVEGDEQEEVDEEDKIQELRDKSKAAHERENSMANKMLGAAGIGATGIGGMMLMQGLSEQSSDADAEEQMRAYLSTFMCKYGDNSVRGGESDIELPGANALLPLYSEYVTLANEVKAMKAELDIKAGIESEAILDSATSGLYDDINTGKTSGAFASLARALQNPEGEDAKKWTQQTEKTSKNIKTGAITAGAGVAVGLVGDIVISAIDKKKAEKKDNKSDKDNQTAIKNFKKKLKDAGIQGVNDLDFSNLDISDMNSVLDKLDFNSVSNKIGNKNITTLLQTDNSNNFINSLLGLFGAK